MKADLNLVKHILQRNSLDPRQTAKIIEEITFETKQQVDPDTAPAVKKQYVILVSDPNDALPRDLIGWIVQIPEEDSPLTTVQKLHRAAYDYNVTPKGRRIPIRTIGEACEATPSRLLKDHNAWVKTKEPVQIISVVNDIPTDKISRDDLQ
ncbi:MAG: hypothetical protein SFY80_10185 [Verrucomicrobiota bacterium]|nr:hypothetical protein [Verrucomicrobiota bacterium]